MNVMTPFALQLGDAAQIGALVEKGGALVVLALVMYFGYRLADKHGTKIGDALNAQAAAQGEQAKSLGSLAANLTESMEHQREGLVVMRAIGQSQDELVTDFRALRSEITKSMRPQA